MCSFAGVYGQLPCYRDLNFYNPDSLNMRHYGQWYLMPNANLDMYVYPRQYSLDELNDGSRGIYVIHSHSCDWNSSSNVSMDYAQPYRTDSTVTIAGISGYISMFYYLGYDDMNCYYFELRDSTLENILAQVRLPDSIADFNIHTPTYTELLFDRPINVSGKFYAVYHTPDTDISRDNDYYLSINQCTFIIGSVEGNSTSDMYATGKPVGNCPWRPIGSIPSGDYNLYGDTIKTLYLFPILADSSFVNLNDTISDTTSGLQSADMDKYTHIFPNPTNNIVNINCAYKMISISVYNSAGVLIKELKPDSYNHSEDLSSYPVGTYVFKIRSTRGSTTRKIIRQ